MNADIRLLAAATLALLLAACATTSHVVTGKVRPPIDPAQVTVYTSPPPKYEEIAVITATSRSSFSFGAQKKMDTVIERLKKEAALLGANGVLLQATGSEGGGGVGAGVGTGAGGGFISTGIFMSSENTTGRGLAIHVPPEPQ
jgi:hypothetical protein